MTWIEKIADWPSKTIATYSSIPRSTSAYKCLMSSVQGWTATGTGIFNNVIATASKQSTPFRFCRRWWYGIQDIWKSHVFSFALNLMHRLERLQFEKAKHTWDQRTSWARSYAYPRKCKARTPDVAVRLWRTTTAVIIVQSSVRWARFGCGHSRHRGQEQDTWVWRVTVHSLGEHRCHCTCLADSVLLRCSQTAHCNCLTLYQAAHIVCKSQSCTWHSAHACLEGADLRCTHLMPVSTCFELLS